MEDAAGYSSRDRRPCTFPGSENQSMNSKWRSGAILDGRFTPLTFEIAAE
jgi:hypothetical protein